MKKVKFCRCHDDLASPVRVKSFRRPRFSPRTSDFMQKMIIPILILVSFIV